MFGPNKHADVIDATAVAAAVSAAAAAVAMHCNRIERREKESLLQHQRVTWFSIRKKMRVLVPVVRATFSFMNFLARKMNGAREEIEVKSAATHGGRLPGEKIR